MSQPSRNSSYSIPDVVNGSDPSASPASLSWILNDVPASTTRSSSFPSTTLPTPLVRHQSPPSDWGFEYVPYSGRSRSPRHSGDNPPSPLSGSRRGGTPLQERKRQRTSDFVESVGNQAHAPIVPPSFRQREQQDVFSVARRGHRNGHIPPGCSTPNVPMATLENPFSGPRPSSTHPSNNSSLRVSAGAFWFGQMLEARRARRPSLTIDPLSSPPTLTPAIVPTVNTLTGMVSRGPERVSNISRATRACDSCKASKTRCNNGGDTRVTCPKCVAKGAVCVYTGENRRRGPLPGQARRSRDTPSSTPLPQVALPSMAERRGQSLPEVPRAARRSPQTAYHLPPLQVAGPSFSANQLGPTRGFPRHPPPLHLPPQGVRYLPFSGDLNQTGLGLNDDPRASMSAGGLVLPPVRDLAWPIPRS